MKIKKASLVLVLVAIVLLPCYALAQGNDPPPPTCCNQDPPQPPPGPSGNSVIAPKAVANDAMPQISISDTTLQAMAITRSQFLDRLATGLFPDADQDVDLVIPVYSQPSAATVSADGTRVSYFEIAKHQVAPEVINAVDLLYITDGKIYMEVIFVRSKAAAR